jgi:integrase
MPFKKGENPNRPEPGSHIIVEPIRSKQVIKRIKKLLKDSPRDYCIFVTGINTAYRAKELLSLKVGQVRDLVPGDTVNVKTKTKKYRRVSLNPSVIEAVQTLLETKDFADDEYLFQSQRGGPVSVSTLSTYVKSWCKNAGLKGNYASHTLRKTWGYWQRIGNNTSIPILMRAFGHATQQQTLSYLGIQEQEINDIYMKLEL